jgi:hypothetical protein
MAIGLGGYGPPLKRFHSTWSYQGPRYVAQFASFLFSSFVRVY